MTDGAEGAIVDRAIGAVVASAVGDALGAGYEFLNASDIEVVEMRPGRLTKRPAGHWTDDTDMAVAVAQGIDEVGEALSDTARHAIGARLLEWYRTDPPDVGAQTRAVLEDAAGSADLIASARRFQTCRPNAARNGSLMRTAPVALAHFRSTEQAFAAGARVSELTHPHPDAVTACSLWSAAIADGIAGSPDPLTSMEGALALLEGAERDRWRSLVHRASPIAPNGWVVAAFQSAWWAVSSASGPSPLERLADGLVRAVRIGDDTDTVSAIAGALLGAHLGASAIPAHWRQGLRGWPPGFGVADLSTLAERLVRRAL